LTSRDPPFPALPSLVIVAPEPVLVMGEHFE
jgi:hypothetical protein